MLSWAARRHEVSGLQAEEALPIERLFASILLRILSEREGLGSRQEPQMLLKKAFWGLGRLVQLHSSPHSSS